MNLTRWLLCLLTIFSGALSAQGNAASQASENSYTSDMTGLTIDLGTSGEARFDPTGHGVYEDAGASQEDVMVRLGNSSIYVSFFEGDISPEEWETGSTELFAAEYFKYEFLGGDITIDQSWSLYRATYMLQFTELQYNEFTLAAYGEYHFSVLVYSTEDRLAGDLAWIADNLRIDGSPIVMQGNDEAAQQAIEGVGGFSPKVISPPEAVTGAWPELGLQSDQSWTSPQHDISVEWTTGWKFPSTLRTAIGVNEETTQDTLILVTPDNNGEAWIIFIEASPPFATPQDWLDRWTSDEWISSVASYYRLTVIDTVVTGNTASVILRGEAKYGDPIVFIYTVSIADDGTTTIVNIRATPDHIGSVYKQFSNEVTIDGEPPVVAWPLEDIQGLPVE